MHDWIEPEPSGQMHCVSIKKTGPNENHKVQIMDHIYRSARRVVVWLGEGDAGSDEAMQLINRIPNKDKKVDDAINNLRTFPNITDPVWRHVINLLNREYFTRLWVSILFSFITPFYLHQKIKYPPSTLFNGDNCRYADASTRSFKKSH